MKSLTKTLAWLALLAGLIFGAYNVQLRRYDITDWWALRSYVPSARLESIARNASLSDIGTRIFYVNNPVLHDKQTFNQYCTIPEATIVLGCYITQGSIHILDVNDSRLTGVHEVTAAHEMLHAAYERLDEKTKTKLQSQLLAQYATITDDSLLKTVEGYRARDPSVVVNELHSILATEVRTLSPELEAYYSRYFSDRSRVVALSEQYEQVFRDIEERVASYDSQLSDLKNSIDTQENSLELQLTSLEGERDRLDKLLSSGDVPQYNSAVPGYNELVKRYNNSLKALQSQVNAYNDLVKQRNEVALEQRTLIESIDSHVLQPEQ